MRTYTSLYMLVYVYAKLSARDFQRGLYPRIYDHGHSFGEILTILAETMNMTELLIIGLYLVGGEIIQ